MGLDFSGRGWSPLWAPVYPHPQVAPSSGWPLSPQLSCPGFLRNPVTASDFSLLPFICKHQVDVQPLNSLNHNVPGSCVTNEGSQNEGTTGSLSSLFLISIQHKCIPMNTTAHFHLLRELLSSPLTLPLHSHVLACGLHTPEGRHCWILIPPNSLMD